VSSHQKHDETYASGQTRALRWGLAVCVGRSKPFRIYGVGFHGAQQIPTGGITGACRCRFRSIVRATAIVFSNELSDHVFE
jgi:hypothetical protein